MMDSLLPWLPPGCLVPSRRHHRTATVLPYRRHHGNGIFDPICGILDLDVDQRGINRAYWLKTAAVQRWRDCGGADGVSVAGQEDGRVLGSAGPDSNPPAPPFSWGLYRVEQ